MPTSLTATKIKDTYGQLLHVDGGVTSTLKTVYDGDGTATALKISTTSVETSGTSVINANSSSDALRITQTGTGNALVVEDSANPDATPFVIDTNGVVISGATSTATVGSGTGRIQAHGFSSTATNNGMLSGAWANSAVQPYYSFVKSRGTSVGDYTVVQSGDRLGTIGFYGSDGSATVLGAIVQAEVDGTPGANDMPGRLIFATTADGASSPTERMRINSAGEVGIGAASATAVSLYVGKNITGSSTSVGILSQATVQSDVTNAAYMFRSRPSTNATAFTLVNLGHYFAIQNTIGAGSTVTNQFGFQVDSSLTGATNNYGFYGNIASGTGRWNFYAAGTADNYFAGRTAIGGLSNGYHRLCVYDNANNNANILCATDSNTAGPGITFNRTRASNATVASGDSIGSINFTGWDGVSAAGTAFILGSVDGAVSAGSVPTRLVFSTSPSGSVSAVERMRIDSAGGVGIGTTANNFGVLFIGKQVSGQTSGSAVYATSTCGSGVTAGLAGFTSRVTTSAAAFTLNTLSHFSANPPTKGVGSTITSQYGFIAETTLTDATNNYGFYGSISAGTGRWNFYAAGSADNYFQGSVGIGITPATKLDVNGDLTVRGGGTDAYINLKTAFTTAYIGWNNAASAFVLQNTLNGPITFATNNIERMRIDSAGNVQIGGTASADARLRLLGSPSSATSTVGLLGQNTMATTTTTFTQFYSSPAVAASASVSNYRHFFCDQPAFGAGAVVTNQYGYVANGLTGATNNYGFFSNIASGAGRWNFYAAGSADNYFAGKLGIGTLPAENLDVMANGRTFIQNTRYSNDAVQPVLALRKARGSSSVPAAVQSGDTISDLQFTAYDGAAFFTTASIQAQIDGTTGVGDLPTRLNFYTTPDGTTTIVERMRIDSAGNIINISTGGLGYGTGSGGAVTQTTSRTQGVTLNKTNGAITLVSAAGTTTWQSFTVTNSTVAATDTIIINQKSGTDLYEIHITAVAAGSFRVSFKTTGGTTTEQPVFNFAVIKAVTA